MLWEKKTSLNQKRGYLYVRETIYVRDKRTLKRKPAKLGDGSAYKQRGKYSKKKDIYCGKIIDDVELKKTIPFKEYIKNFKKKDFLQYRTDVEFEILLDDFIEYLLFIHGLKKENLFEGNKKAYAIATGYLSRGTLQRVKEFTPKSTMIDYKELERFANRCFDSGIFDEEIIMLLYSKLLPQGYIEEEFEEEFSIISQKHRGLRDFIQKEHDKETR